MKKFLVLASVLSFLLVACAPAQKSASHADSEILPPTQTNKEASIGENPPAKNEKSTGQGWNEWNESADISHVDEEKKLAAFTFDDAPAFTLKKILQVFETYNQANPDRLASATVFVNGVRVDPSARALLQAAYDAGFELGNHTYSHSDLTALSAEQVRKEIDDVDEILYKIDGKKKHLVRAPYGKFNDELKKTAHAPLIDWAVDTEDWKGISAEQICTAVLTDIYPGAIVLMHDGYRHTVEALETLLPTLKEKGYQIVTVSQLSKAWHCPFQEGSIYTHIKKRK